MAVRHYLLLMCGFHKAWTGVGHMLGWIVRGAQDLGEVCILSGMSIGLVVLVLIFGHLEALEHPIRG